MALWNPDAELPASLARGQDDSNAPDPFREAERLAAMKRLRHRLVQQASALRQKVPVLTFERWLARSSLNMSQTDPVIPMNDVLDGRLVKDLSRVVSVSNATTVASAMAEEGRAAAKRVADFIPEETMPPDTKALSAELKSCAHSVRSSAKIARDALNEESSSDWKSTLAALRQSSMLLTQCTEGIQRATGTVECVTISKAAACVHKVSLTNPDGSIKRPYLKVTTPHLEKLLRLYRISINDTTAIVDMEQEIEHLPSIFLNSVYCILSRYECLQGAGYQCAVPAIAFDALLKIGLGTTIECFSSPLNCRYSIYCSAFPDLERRFGSLGSFFDDEAFFPCEGSFEANPPFVPELMEAMNDKILRLLRNREAKALSFLVIIPAWGDGMTYYRDLKASKYTRASSIVAASDHAFCDGAQHSNGIRQDGSARLRPSSWNTAVLLLQNDDGAKRWTVETQELEEVFCGAIRSATASMPDRTIKAWEARVGQPASKRKRD